MGPRLYSPGKGNARRSGGPSGRGYTAIDRDAEGGRWAGSDRAARASAPRSWRRGAGSCACRAPCSASWTPELSAAHDLPLRSYEVLLLLEDAPRRRLRMADLSRSVLLSASGMTRLVDRLEREGLVGRERCPEDGRGYFAVLTDEGDRRLQEARATHLAGVRRLFLERLRRRRPHAPRRVLGPARAGLGRHRRRVAPRRSGRAGSGVRRGRRRCLTSSSSAPASPACAAPASCTPPGSRCSSSSAATRRAGACAPTRSTASCSTAASRCCSRRTPRRGGCSTTSASGCGRSRAARSSAGTAASRASPIPSVTRSRRSRACARRRGACPTSCASRGCGAGSRASR